MSFLDTRLYRWMEVLTDFFLLNLLWLLFCIPLITLFPATAALFSVVRDWSRGKEQGVFAPFFGYMRACFVQSLAVGLAWTVVGLVLAADFLFVRGITSWVRMPLLVMVLAMGVVYGGTAVYLFPVMVHYHLRWWEVIRNSIVIVFSSPGLTLLCLLIITLAALALYFAPISLLGIGSITAYVLFRLCHRRFQQSY